MVDIEYLRTLPKAELHLHIEGSLEPELMFELATRNHVSLKYKSVQEIKDAYNFHNLQSFLDIYYEGAKVLLTKQDFFDLTYAYLKRAHADGVCHVEIFFDPQTHTHRGVSFQTVVEGIYEALEAGKKEFQISFYLIMCFLRHLSEEEAFVTLKEALPFKKYIKGVGLDSAEMGNPPEKFTRVFDQARQHGFLTVAHAGEEGPADYIWQCLDQLKVERIDHGVRCVEDPALMKHLIDKKMALTVCPLSNIKLKVFNHMQEHNIKSLFEKGVKVTINSDDPAYFGGYILENFIECQKHLGFSNVDMAKIALNSFEHSFLSEEDKEKIRQKPAFKV